MKISPLGWLLTVASVLSIALLGPRIGSLSGPQDFSSSLIDVIALIQVALSVWVVGSFALLLAAQRSRWARRLSVALTPTLIRRAFVAGMAGALVAAPASADSQPVNQTGSHRFAGGESTLSGLRLPDRPSGRSGPSALPVVPASADVVEVRAGDSLWSIATDLLPSGAPDAQIASTSASWYKANRDLIGHDPDLIFPDMVLHPPQPEESP